MPAHSEGRRLLIEQALSEAGQVSVLELAARFEVSDETIRRDLEILADEGKARRVYGGAVSTRSLPESQLAERMTINGESKKRIARLAVTRIREGELSIFLDSGSSTAYLAELLPDRENLSVFTNCVAIAASLGARTNKMPIYLLGGRVREVTLATVGSETTLVLSRLHPDIAFMGTNGFSVGDGYTTPDAEEAAAKTMMVQNSRLTVMLADADKFGRTSTVSFAQPHQIDQLISDETLADMAGEVLKQLAKEVFLV